YVRNPRLAKDFNELVFIFDHTVRGGYGWIFPGPDGVFNIGIGYFGSAEKNSGLRRDYDTCAIPASPRISMSWCLSSITPCVAVTAGFFRG
ncbi:hypothetical protein CQA09_28610, partial [Klebsiella pneumoniae]